MTGRRLGLGGIEIRISDLECQPYIIVYSVCRCSRGWTDNFGIEKSIREYTVRRVKVDTRPLVTVNFTLSLDIRSEAATSIDCMEKGASSVLTSGSLTQVHTGNTNHVQEEGDQDATVLRTVGL